MKNKMTSNESDPDKHIGVLGGYWKCEDCGLLIEDELLVCPECQSKKITDLDSYIGVGRITLDQQEEMIADEGYAKRFERWQISQKGMNGFLLLK
jgi:RNA polymerase subunit RPABC4/transcription elongation factor Spt4